MRIALFYTSNPGKRIALNKDLNGGLGTADDYGSSLAGKILSWLKWKFIALPVISIAHLQAILKSQGHEVHYYEDMLPEDPFDLGLMYGSLVDFHNENALVAQIKKKFPSSPVGFFGSFPGRFPDKFSSGDFVLSGEAEAFAIYSDICQLTRASGLVKNDAILKMDDMPSPDYAGFPISRYSYRPMLPKRPYLPLLASKGCPYSCGFYCSYGEYQKPKYRQRSADKVYSDMKYLRDIYGVKSIQFRDPIFGLDKNFIQEFCAKLIREPLNIEWGMETRSDLLNPELLDRLKGAGLRSINIGIETLDPKIAKINKRKLDDENHQEMMIKYAKKAGIRINAFFIFGLEEDTPDGLEHITRYALELDPEAARFCVSTPYPGTGFYDMLSKQERILDLDWEKYTQFSLVYKHLHLTPEQVERHMVRSYIRFYFRPQYILRTLFSNIKNSLNLS